MDWIGYRIMPHIKVLCRRTCKAVRDYLNMICQPSSNVEMFVLEMRKYTVICLMKYLECIQTISKRIHALMRVYDENLLII